MMAKGTVSGPSCQASSSGVRARCWASWARVVIGMAKIKAAAEATALEVESVVDSFEVLLGFGVYANFLALFDEDRDAHAETGFRGDELGGALDGVAFDGFFGFGDEVDDLGWNLDVEDFVIVDGATIGLAVLHEELVALECGHGDFDLVVGVDVHHVEVFAVVVHVLEVHHFNVDVFYAVLAFDCFLQNLACCGAFELESDKGRAFAGVYEFAFNADEWLTFD